MTDERVEELIKTGADTNARDNCGCTALYFATEIANLLRSYGAKK